MVNYPMIAYHYNRKSKSRIPHPADFTLRFIFPMVSNLVMCVPALRRGMGGWEGWWMLGHSMGKNLAPNHEEIRVETLGK